MVGYGIYFMRGTGFFRFSQVQSMSENMKKSCLLGEINFLFNIKSIEISVYYISFDF